MDYSALGRRVRLIRRCMGITQAQLAEMAGISTAFVGHIERGTRVLSVETLCRICKALAVSADYLIGLKE